MKSVRVLLMGEHLRDVYPHATRWQVIKWKVMKFIKRVVRITGVAAGITVLMAGAYFYGEFEKSRTLVASAEAQEIHEVAPVLDRIAQAESHKSHYCTDELIAAKMCWKYEKGQVLTNVNKDGTIDIGYYQINSIHGSKAAELGYDLTVEADNKAFGEWLYANQGTEPWYSSKHSW